MEKVPDVARTPHPNQVKVVSSPSQENAFSAAQSLTLLVTMESLLFAALNVGLALALPAVGGRNISRTGAYRLAKLAAACLTVVAAGALLAWWQVFIDEWPTSFLRKLIAGAVAVGVCAQPVISWIAVRAIKPPARGA